MFYIKWLGGCFILFYFFMSGRTRSISGEHGSCVDTNPEPGSAASMVNTACALASAKWCTCPTVSGLNCFQAYTIFVIFFVLIVCFILIPYPQEINMTIND